MTSVGTHGWQLARAALEIASLPEVRLLGLVLVVQVSGGTAFYVVVEDWSWVESLYSCVSMITTVGVGDPPPVTTAGKLFTVFYLLSGVGTLLSFVTLFATRLAAWRPGPREKSMLDIDADR